MITIGQPANSQTSKYRLKRLPQAWIFIIPIESGPVHIGIAGIDFRKWDDASAIWTPNPGDIVGPDRSKDIVNVAPGRDKLPRGITVDHFAPNKPISVHLPVKAQEQWVAPSLGVGGPLPDKGVMHTVDDV